MYENVGKKIKGIATGVAVIGIIISIILGIVIMVVTSNSYFISGGVGVLIGFLVMILGSLLSWLSSIKLYAYGQLVESAQNIEKKILGDENVRVSAQEPEYVAKPDVDNAVSDLSDEDNRAIATLNEMLINGHITKEEFDRRFDEIVNNSDGQETIKRCPNCNAELREDAEFCTNCGRKIY